MFAYFYENESVTAVLLLKLNVLFMNLEEDIMQFTHT